jgi:hypothetical protein
MDRGRIARGLFLAAALALALLFGRRWPKDQTVHYVLGNSATRVEEVDARWSGDAQGGDEWAREVSFRYRAGRAPRVVTHEPRLPDGDYTVEIELVAADSGHAFVRRHVALSGGVTSIDVSSAVPQ